jgi:hypothetical protein
LPLMPLDNADALAVRAAYRAIDAAALKTI